MGGDPSLMPAAFSESGFIHKAVRPDIFVAPGVNPGLKGWRTLRNPVRDDI